MFCQVKLRCIDLSASTCMCQLYSIACFQKRTVLTPQGCMLAAGCLCMLLQPADVPGAKEAGWGPGNAFKAG